MDVARQNKTRLWARRQAAVAAVWYTLQRPHLTAGLVAALALVLLAGWALPGQTTPAGDMEGWVSTLPPWLQLWGEPLYFLGFARIFRSLWFWLPAGLLLLNSLIALANYTPGAWRRLGRTAPNIEWQHPLARRAEQVVRLPKSPDAYLAGLQEDLTRQKFFIYPPPEGEERLIAAARRRWAWLGPVAGYGGLVLLVAGFMVSHFFLQTGRMALFPQEAAASPLLGGELLLSRADTAAGGQVIFSATGAEKDRQYLAWQLYRPALLNGVWVIPLARNPLLTVEVRGRDGALLKLIPVQEDLPPTERLNLPVNNRRDALYFVIPSVKTAVRILPNPASGPNSYLVQVRPGSDAPAQEPLTVQAGQAFNLNGLSVTLLPGHSLELAIFYDPAIWLYGLAALLVLAGIIFTLALPPLQVWLIPEVKGIGGRLYGVVEKPGSINPATQFLARLLAPPDASGDAPAVPEADAPPPAAEPEDSPAAKPSPEAGE